MVFRPSLSLQANLEGKMTDQTHAVEAMEGVEISTASTDLADLPGDVFAMIIENLEAWDIVRCQMVSSAWLQAFSAPEFLRINLKKYLPTREARHLIPDTLLPNSPRESDAMWRTTFSKIAGRYFHLTHGKPRTIQKHKTAVPERSEPTNWFPVNCWEYHESQPGGRLHYLQSAEPHENPDTRPGEQAYLFNHAFWSYEDGLLGFAPGRPFNFAYDAAEVPMHSPSTNFAIIVLDLKSQHGVQVPFDVKDRVVRNLRLKDRTLIIEWAEKAPYHALNDSEVVHRHFATCYDVKPHPTSSGGTACRWTVTFRSEWKLHFLGLPLNHQDRFFSTHTKDHYAVYLWQPNRSMYTGDEEQPIECLLIWDIAQPRQYMPSLDPGGNNHPGGLRRGPYLVARFDYRLLEHYGIRQHSSPSLIKFSLDSEQHTITVHENSCIAGQGYFDPAERLWCVKTTNIPFRGEGPHLQRECDGKLPPYRGNCSMETSDVLDPEPWFLGIMDVVDEKADVRFSLVQSVFTGKDVHNMAFVRIWALQRMATLDEATTRQIAHMGKIAGDERFLVGQNDSQEIVVLRFD
jgi:hypothetical protein